MSDFDFDWAREQRTGLPETVLCLSKSAAQIEHITALAHDIGRRLLLTRLDSDRFEQLSDAAKSRLDYDAQSKTAILGAKIDAGDFIQGVGIVTAGTSDLSVGKEAQRTLAFAGFSGPIIADVGVAGIARLLRRIDEIRTFRVIIAMAGMEGALFSVLAGLVDAPVIAVPTSVGYGVAEGGRVALHAALASCAPGVLVVNIDNGFGAAQAAIKIVRQMLPARDDGQTLAAAETSPAHCMQTIG